LPIIGLINAVVFIIVFMVLIIVTRILLAVFKQLDKNIVIEKFDGLLGGVLGLVEAGIVLFIIVIAVKLLMILGDSNMVLFNQETIERTKLFKYIFNLKFIGY
jgi:uncharacterized membrane protein required for colicin V production